MRPTSKCCLSMADWGVRAGKKASRAANTERLAQEFLQWIEAKQEGIFPYRRAAPAPRRQRLARQYLDEVCRITTASSLAATAGTHQIAPYRGDAALARRSGGPSRQLCVQRRALGSCDRDRSASTTGQATRRARTDQPSNTVTAALSHWNMRSNTSRSCMAIAFPKPTHAEHLRALAALIEASLIPRATGENLRKSPLHPHAHRRPPAWCEATRRTSCSRHRSLMNSSSSPAGSAIKPKIGKPGARIALRHRTTQNRIESFSRRCSGRSNRRGMERFQLSFGGSTSPSTNRVSLIGAVEGLCNGTRNENGAGLSAQFSTILERGVSQYCLISSMTRLV